MRRRVLESLASQGALVAFVSTPNDSLEASEAILLAHSFNTSALSLIIDFQGIFKSYSVRSCESLFSTRFHFNESIEEQDGFALLTSNGVFIPEDSQSIHLFLQNLVSLQKQHPFILLFLPAEHTSFFEKLLSAVQLMVVYPTDEQSLSTLSKSISSMDGLRKEKILWLFSLLPSSKEFPRLHKEVKIYSDIKQKAVETWKKDFPAFAVEIKNILKIQILKKNPLDGFARVFLSLWPLLLVFALIIPFLIPKKLEPTISNLRDARQERNALSGAPYFLFECDGKETLQRIGRYAVGRFNAQVTTEKTLNQYVEEVLEKNGYPKSSWRKEKVNIPPRGTRLQFLPSEFLSPAKNDSLGLAWGYFTSLISDSIAYLTELYHESPKEVGRVHRGIDIASRHGARILAPFAAKAWTFKDERGGVVIGLVHEKKVMLFMHCDQLLYLDGQEVMAGDPIATVGTTGHTTGPHVHLETGIVQKKGDKFLGNIRYKTVNPITWFYLQVKK